MHKIGITNREMYQMVIKEGIRNGVVALAVIGIVQVVLCMNRNIGFHILHSLICRNREYIEDSILEHLGCISDEA